jgi:uncharacterized protein (DUF58 family)
VKGTATPKLHVYAALAGVGMIAALALGRPELAALAAPFAAFVLIGLILARPPELRVIVALDRDRQIEGRHVDAEVEVAGRGRGVRLEVLMPLPEGIVSEDPNPRVLRVPAVGEQEFELRLRCERWGGYEVGEVLWRARDPLGLVTFEGSAGQSYPLKVYPREEVMQTLLHALETQAYSGNQVARYRGDGIEFADMRPFVAGDRVRRVNWRATARRGVPWVNEAHPERNSDVVIFLDTFAEARRDDTGTLDLAVRAAATFAGHYLKEKDRVGLVSFGGVLNWLTVSSGMTQLYRVLDSLIDAEIMLSYAWKDLDIIPARTLPPRALVLAISPLLDERAVGALLDLRARGFDLVVIEVSPFPFLDEAETETGQLAERLWRLRREALRSRYFALGVPVVEWHEGTPLEAVVEEVTGFRRHARVVRA